MGVWVDGLRADILNLEPTLDGKSLRSQIFSPNIVC